MKCRPCAFIVHGRKYRNRHPRESLRNHGSISSFTTRPLEAGSAPTTTLKAFATAFSALATVGTPVIAVAPSNSLHTLTVLLLFEVAVTVTEITVVCGHLLVLEEILRPLALGIGIGIAPATAVLEIGIKLTAEFTLASVATDASVNSAVSLIPISRTAVAGAMPMPIPSASGRRISSRTRRWPHTTVISVTVTATSKSSRTVSVCRLLEGATAMTGVPTVARAEKAVAKALRVVVGADPASRGRVVKDDIEP